LRSKGNEVANLDQKRTNLDSDIGRLSDLKDADNGVEELIREHRKTLNGLNGQVSNLQDTILRDKGRRAILVADIEDLERTQENAVEEKRSVLTDLEGLKKQKAEARLANQEWSDLTRKRDDIEKELQIIQKREYELRDQINNLLNRKRFQVLENASKESQLEVLQEQLDQMSEDIANKGRERANLDTNVDFLKQRVADFEGKRDNLIRQIAALQKQIKTKPTPTDSSKDSVPSRDGPINDDETGAE
jgi:chromosome segregation ATPase